MKRRRKLSRRRPWRVVCPDKKLRAFPQLTRMAASIVALDKTVQGCRPFPDDPRRWWKKRCAGGTHRVKKVAR